MYKGVSFHKPVQKWVAHIKFNGKVQHLGYFEDEREAAEAYNAAALEHFGEYAKLNEFENYFNNLRVCPSLNQFQRTKA